MAELDKNVEDLRTLLTLLRSLKGEMNPLLMGSPGIGMPPSSMAQGGGLEMFLLERAKALQNNPIKPWGHFPGAQGFPLRSSLFPAPLPNLDNNPLPPDDVLSQWRRSLPGLPSHFPQSEDKPLPPSPSPQMSPEKREPSPTPLDRPPSNTSLPAVTNGGSKPPSESGTPSPRRTESASPASPPKSECSPMRELRELQIPQITQLPPMSHHQPHPLTNLSVPPLISTSRIPKSDPMEGRLQDMLRYNMEKYAGQALDTLADSRRVRELLSVHNIGQRLFAKYVLGLSQGTVSELLSKPKSWDKLTEKGRDSYRKMHAWAYDEQAIQLLKTLIPRKGELVRSLSSSPLLLKGSDHHSGQDKSLHMRSEDRVAKILNDANKTYGADHSKLPQKPLTMENPQDTMSRVYREELARIKGFMEVNQHLPNPQNMMPNPLFPGLEVPPGFHPKNPGNIHEEISRRYHEELNRLQQTAIASAMKEQSERIIVNKTPTKLDEFEDRSDSDKNDIAASPDDEIEIKKEITPKSEPLGPNTNAIILQKPFFPPSPKDDSSLNSVSPLQRIASITNSLITQTPPMSFGQSPQRPLRAVLPPITQQQFDRYSHLITEDVVRRIKDILSQYSISQRLFGENVLGLSQGSVSDLLARPKPWHMLTQKGREPFIRMKLFLDDDGAVHRLVASQYKIAPDRLMRTGTYAVPNPMGFTELPPFPAMPPHRPPSTKLPEHGLIRPSFENPLIPSTLRFGADPNLADRPSPILDPLAAHRKMMAQRPPGFPPSIGPSLYEMAALTNELDTQTITTKIKEILLAHNVGQKLFGESVLGLSQGSVSELLSKPKPWHMLSIKGREPFIRMQLWLSDPSNMDKLIEVKNEKRENSKRKRGGVDSSSDRSSPADTMDDYSNSGMDSPGASAKKSRVFFSDEQREALKIAFALDPYPSTSAMEYLSQELKLENKTISNWFHNHRMRLKQAHGTENLLMGGIEGQSFDPNKFKLLMNHRKLELQGGGPQLSFLPGLNPALFGLPTSATGVDTGLDLRFKAVIDEESNDGEISEDSGSEKKDMDIAEKDDGGHSPTPSETPQMMGGRSRRKAAAPQWVNPDFLEHEEENNDQNVDEEPINGVCVRNIQAFGDENQDIKSEEMS